MIVYMNVVVTVPCYSVWDPRMRYSVFIRPSFPNTDICIIIQMAQNAQKVCALRHFASLKWNITNRLERPVSFLCSGLNLLPFFCTIFFLLELIPLRRADVFTDPMSPLQAISWTTCGPSVLHALVYVIRRLCTAPIFLWVSVECDWLPAHACRCLAQAL